MQNNLKATSRFMKRRSFMAKLGIATAAATLPASLSANDDDEQTLTGGDVAILRFLAAAEIID